MSSVDRFPDPVRGPRWRARTRTPEGQSRSRVFDKRAAAVTWLAALDGARVVGTYVDPAAGRVTVRQYVDDIWLPSQGGAPGTVAKRQSVMRRHVLPAFGGRPLAAVRPSEVQRWALGLIDAGLKPATREVIHAYAAQMFRAAVDDQLIARSPWLRITAPNARADREVITEDAVLTGEQVWAIAEAMDEPHRTLVLVAAATGLRQAEVLGLTVPALFLLGARQADGTVKPPHLRVEQQLSPLGGLHLTPRLKTRKARRTVPLSPLAVGLLSEHLARFPATRGDALVWVNSRGEPIHRNGLMANVWAPAVVKAGLPAGLRFHGLRHFYASALIAAGASVRSVQEVLGHASAVETLNTYAGLWRTHDDLVAGAIEAALGRSGVMPVSAAAGGRSLRGL